MSGRSWEETVKKRRPAEHITSKERPKRGAGTERVGRGADRQSERCAEPSPEEREREREPSAHSEAELIAYLSAR